MLHDGLLRVPERIHYAVVYMALLSEDLDLLGGLLQRLHYLFVGLFLIEFLFLLHGVLFAGVTELILQLLNDVKVSVRDLLVVLLDLLVLLRMLLS